MRFQIPLIAAAAALTSAAALPKPEAVEVNVSNGLSSEVLRLSANANLEKRQGLRPTLSFYGDKSTQAALVIGKILNEVLNDLLPLKDWTRARETFTKTTTQLMWDNNPNRNRWVAVACYNKRWNVKDYNAIFKVVSVTLRLGDLYTDYDCMYIGRYNQFYTRDEGGYINLAYVYNGQLCSFDHSTGDLTCN